MPKPAKRAAPAKPPANKKSTLKASKAPVPAPSTLPASIVNAAPAAAEMMQHIVAVSRLIPELEKQLARAEKNGAVAMARAFVVFHRLVTRHGELLKPLADLFEDYKGRRIPALFEQEGVPNVPLAEGYRVQQSSRFYASIIAEKKNEAFAWLRDNGLGDIVAETVNAQTLSASAKVLRDDKNIELPDEFFKTADVPNTSVVSTK